MYQKATRSSLLHVTYIGSKFKTWLSLFTLKPDPAPPHIKNRKDAVVKFMLDLILYLPAGLLKTGESTRA